MIRMISVVFYLQKVNSLNEEINALRHANRTYADELRALQSVVRALEEENRALRIEKREEVRV